MATASGHVIGICEAMRGHDADAEVGVKVTEPAAIPWAKVIEEGGGIGPGNVAICIAFIPVCDKQGAKCRDPVSDEPAS